MRDNKRTKKINIKNMVQYALNFTFPFESHPIEKKENNQTKNTVHVFTMIFAAKNKTKQKTERERERKSLDYVDEGKKK